MPSEVAEAIALIAAELPTKTKSTLAHLLSRDLAEQAITAPSPASRLGLLLELLLNGGGKFPTVRDYEAARGGSSENWPSGSQLIRSYGTWVIAVRTAASLESAGPVRARKTSYPSHPYSTKEVLLSVLKFRVDLGHWPTTQAEYSAWAAISRAIQLRWGKTTPRIASGSNLRTKLGSLENAVKITERRYAPDCDPSQELS